MATVKVLSVNGEILFEGHEADAREKVEEMLFEKLGFAPCLQESLEENELFIYLHSDTYEELSEEELEQLEQLDITEDTEDTTVAITSLLNLTFVVVEGVAA